MIEAKTSSLATSSIALDFSSMIDWNLESLALDTVAWLHDLQASATSSKVGIFSSPQFAQLISPYVNEDTKTKFQQMVYAQSLVHTQINAPEGHTLSMLELQQIAAIAGHRKNIDIQTKPQILAQRRSREELLSLLLILIGTILAVGYTRPAEKFQPMASEEKQSSFEAMQEHLCRTLTSHMIFIGTRLGFTFSCDAEKFITDAAFARWHKQGLFRWRSKQTHNCSVLGIRVACCTGMAKSVPQESLNVSP
jgi:hypothetical protein